MPDDDRNFCLILSGIPSVLETTAVSSDSKRMKKRISAGYSSFKPISCISHARYDVTKQRAYRGRFYKREH
jgi:hypothetical protein